MEWCVPQADDLEKIGLLPMKIRDGHVSSSRIAKQFGFTIRQASYYRHAAEILGLVRKDYSLTSLGKKYVQQAETERRKLLLARVCTLPLVKEFLRSEKIGIEISLQWVANIIQRETGLAPTTSRRRAQTLMAWLTRQTLMEIRSYNLPDASQPPAPPGPDIVRRISHLNRKYKHMVPEKRERVSIEIERAPQLSRWLKALRDYTCQICGTEGFLMKDNSRYVEVHHIEELHKLLPESLCSENVLVVCANCHRKMHFADVEISTDANAPRVFRISINGNEFIVERNAICEEVL